VKDAGAVLIVASVENRSTCGTVDAAQLKLKLAHGATGGSFTEIPMGAQTPAQGSDHSPPSPSQWATCSATILRSSPTV
jgi:hypothetical protein